MLEIQTVTDNQVPDTSTGTYYERTAMAFAERVKRMFASEDSLRAVWEKHFSGSEFDRTDRWNMILFKELNQVWQEVGPPIKNSLTNYDRDAIVDLLSATDMGSISVLSQVILNLQNNALLHYNNPLASEHIDALKLKYAGKSPSPFELKAKMFKTANTEDEKSFNRDLSTLKALKIVSGVFPWISFRVSPTGSTPALVDSQNLSMLGIGGDGFLKPLTGFTAYYFSWENTPDVLAPLGEGRFTFRTPAGHEEEYASKSGGDTLGPVLLSRSLAIYLFWRARGYKRAVLPRMNSVLLVTDASEEKVRDIFSRAIPNIVDQPWNVTLSVGSR
jgi:hypothetical protein